MPGVERMNSVSASVLITMSNSRKRQAEIFATVASTRMGLHRQPGAVGHPPQLPADGITFRLGQ